MPLWPGGIGAGKLKQHGTDAMPMVAALGDKGMDAVAPLMTNAATQLGTLAASKAGTAAMEAGAQGAAGLGGTIGGWFGPSGAAVGTGIGEALGQAGTVATDMLGNAGKFMTDNAAQFGQAAGQAVIPAGKAMARGAYQAGINGLDLAQNMSGVQDAHPEAERGRRMRSMLASMPMQGQQSAQPHQKSFDELDKMGQQIRGAGIGALPPPSTIPSSQMNWGDGGFNLVQADPNLQKLAAGAQDPNFAPAKPMPRQRQPMSYGNLGRSPPRY
jgi:hypothetical protein